MRTKSKILLKIKIRFELINILKTNATLNIEITTLQKVEFFVRFIDKFRQNHIVTTNVSQFKRCETNNTQLFQQIKGLQSSHGTFESFSNSIIAQFDLFLILWKWINEIKIE